MGELVTRIPEARPNRLASRLPRPLRYALFSAQLSLALLLVACGGGAAKGKEQNPDQGSRNSGAEVVKNPNNLLILPFPPDLEMKIQQGFAYQGDTGVASSETHGGIDFIKGQRDQSVTWKDFLVLAAADGEACFNPPSREGNAVFMRHTNPGNGETYYTYYGHVVAAAPTIPECSSGKTTFVRQRETIATAGATGTTNASWIHLHFQVNNSAGQKVDPFDIYGQRGQYPGLQSADGKLCGPNALFKECPMPNNRQALTANPRETAPKIPSMPTAAPPAIKIPERAATTAPPARPTPKPFQPGDRVTVIGTSPDCLLERVEPSQSAAKRTDSSGEVICWPDGSQLTIAGGRYSDGDYNWRQLSDGGWSAETFLEKVQTAPKPAEAPRQPEAPPGSGWVRHKSADIGYSIEYPSSWSVTQEPNPHGGFQNKFQEQGKAAYPPKIVVGSEMTRGRSLDEIMRTSEGAFLQSPGNTVILEKSKMRILGKDAGFIKARMTIPLLPNRPDLDTVLDMTYTVFIDGGKGWAFFMLSETSQTARLLPIYNHMVNSIKF